MTLDDDTWWTSQSDVITNVFSNKYDDVVLDTCDVIWNQSKSNVMMDGLDSQSKCWHIVSVKWSQSKVMKCGLDQK